MVDNILAYIEQTFHSTNQLPSTQKLADHFDLNLRQLAGITRRKEFKEKYEARGLPTFNEFNQRQVTKVLTPIQLAVANQILNTSDRKSLRAKLTSMNVTTLQYQAMLKDLAFQDYLRRESQARFNNSDISARLSLIKLVDDADLNAIKFFYEVSGQYSPAQTQALNLSQILSLLMEILVAYLGPAQLIEIADKLETLLNNSNNPTSSMKASSALPVGSIFIPSGESGDVA